MSTTVPALLGLAAAQLGTYERTGRNDVLYSDYWGITGYAWCYAFVQWCFDQQARLPFITMYVPAGVGWSRDNWESVEWDQPPRPGDIVHFTWDMDVWPRNKPGTGDHVGIVESWDGGDTLTTIEGNVGSPQGVWRLKRSISQTVINYWRPLVYTDTPPPEEDMTPDQDFKHTDTHGKVTHLFNIFNDGNRWADWYSRSRAAGHAITFVHDTRDGKVWMVWGTMWKRWVKSQKELDGFQSYWRANGAQADLQPWDPVHIDAIPDVEHLFDNDLLVKIYDVVKGKLPPPVIDVEKSLAQATIPQLVAELNRRYSAADVPGLPQ